MQSHLNRVDILSNAASGHIDQGAACVDLLWVDTVLGMQVLHLSVGEDAVELAADLELGLQLRQQSKALLLPCKLQKVLP